MKTKLIFTLCLCFFVKQLHAQWINSLTVIPPNPTTADSVTVILNADFSSGPCNDATHGFFQNGFMINAFTLHCTGMLTVICTDEDTFQLGQLATGNYTFTVQVDQGQGPSPCTPGIVAGPSGTVNFTVTSSSSVNNPEISNSFFITPNPTNGFVKLLSNGSKHVSEKMLVTFYSIEGKLLLQVPAMQLARGIYLPFKNGMYVAVMRVDNKLYKQKFILN